MELAKVERVTRGGLALRVTVLIESADLKTHKRLSDRYARRLPAVQQIADSALELTADALIREHVLVM